MKLESITSKLLYVPFNHDYIVDEEIKELLTEEEFFEKCFFKPNFAQEIQELISASVDEVQVFDADLTKEELIKKYERKEEEEEALYNWIESNQNDIYCVKGDAGTGKSTFLHHLKYEYRYSNIIWKIIDIQKAINPIRILGQEVIILHNNVLYAKAISSLILCICNDLFYYENGNINFERSLQNLRELSVNYINRFEFSIPSKEVREFFENIQIFVDDDGNCRDRCLLCAECIALYFNELFEKYENSLNRLFGYFVELYVCFLRCQNENVRYMIAFDNFERFIGTDEIYSWQLTEFVINMRNVQNSIAINDANLSRYFQIIIFMRNTSTRMFTPQQVADLFPHRLDLSEWFQISKILEKKVKWYNEREIEILEADQLMDILNDIGFCRGEFRGLRSKLNMLFNNNKRIIIRFMTQILARNMNREYLMYYDIFKKNTVRISPSFARFSARTIIFRLVLNELRYDGFFRHIVVQKNNEEKASLGYARKILTILYDFHLRHEDAYMNFSDIINILYAHIENAQSLYFNENNRYKRKIISQVLFFMNYYDGRKDNWLQFIDIQYNLSERYNVRIRESEDLRRIIDEHYQNIRIRITSAGIAYLYFVVYSFEYFACKSIYSEKKLIDYGTQDFPPLLCSAFELDDILNKDINNFECMKILNIVSDEVISCINIMEEEENQIPFKKNVTDVPISHKERIINSQCGYIDNFIQCIREIYKEKIINDEEFEKKFRALVTGIRRIREKYLNIR